MASIEASSEKIETPCGAGTMVWRKWGEGPPLVLFHGGQGAWTHWIHNVLELARTHTVFAADMPGYGDSAALPEPVKFEDITSTLIDGLERILPRQTFDLMGFSFGSVIGGMVAAELGERVRTFIVVGPGGLGPTQRMEEFANWRLAGDSAALAEAHRHNLRVQMIADPARIDNLAVYLQTQNTARAITKSRRLIRPDSSVQKKSLPLVKARLHAIWGSQDSTAGPLLAERGALLGELQPGAKYTLVPGAGHWVAFEDPKVFNKIALRELGS